MANHQGRRHIHPSMGRGRKPCRPAKSTSAHGAACSKRHGRPAGRPPRTPRNKYTASRRPLGARREGGRRAPAGRRSRGACPARAACGQGWRAPRRPTNAARQRPGALSQLLLQPAPSLRKPGARGVGGEGGSAPPAHEPRLGWKRSGLPDGPPPRCRRPRPCCRPRPCRGGGGDRFFTAQRRGARELKSAGAHWLGARARENGKQGKTARRRPGDGLSFLRATARLQTTLTGRGGLQPALYGVPAPPGGPPPRCGGKAAPGGGGGPLAGRRQ